MPARLRCGEFDFATRPARAAATVTQVLAHRAKNTPGAHRMTRHQK